LLLWDEAESGKDSIAKTKAPGGTVEMGTIFDLGPSSPEIETAFGQGCFATIDNGSGIMCIG
jgi:hypothetical protein